jgi:hypothetical protein
LDKKLEQSIKDQREFSKMQSQINRYFLNQIKNDKKVKPIRKGVPTKAGQAGPG